VSICRYLFNSSIGKHPAVNPLPLSPRSRYRERRPVSLSNVSSVDRATSGESPPTLRLMLDDYRVSSNDFLRGLMILGEQHSCLCDEIKYFIFEAFSSLRDFHDSTIGRFKSCWWLFIESRRFNQSRRTTLRTLRRSVATHDSSTSARYNYLPFLAEGSRAQRGDDSAAASSAINSSPRREPKGEGENLATFSRFFAGKPRGGGRR